MNAAVAMLLSGVFGLGLITIFAGLRRPVQPLNVLGTSEETVSLAPGYSGFFGWFDEIISSQTGTSLASDLSILNVDRRTYETRRLSVAALLAGVPYVFFLFIAAVTSSPSLAIVSSVICLVLFFVSLLGYWWSFHGKAQKERDVMRHGLSIFLDLAVLQLAGGAGVAASLDAAAERGSGTAFRRIRTALQVASSQGQGLSPYESLRQLGEELALPDLVDLGNAMDRAESTGGEVKSALRRQAHRVRTKLGQDEKAAAGSRSVTMTLPQTLMLAGFMIFLLFPFIAALFSG